MRLRHGWTWTGRPGCRREDAYRTGRLARARSVLPEGQLLPDRSWQRRHRGVVVLLWLHVVGLAAFALVQGYGTAHALLEAAFVAVPTMLAATKLLGRRMRMMAASFGLVTASAVLVHLSHGSIEAHFHFFVVIPILVLYQDWAPFLLCLAYVVIHHGALGPIDSSSIYNHPDALAHPWKWAFIHAAFVLGASAASLVGWRANEQMLHEPLTGLPGRAVFLHRTTLALEQLQKRSRCVAVLFVDLNRFKLLNDTLGHAVGDELLVEVSRRLGGTVRRSDVVARLGGDEFAILCRDVQLDAVTAIAERVHHALANPIRLGSAREVLVGVSIGIAVTSSPQTGADELIGNADAAMYRAKAQGARYVTFDEKMRHEDAERLATETALRRALERDELRVFYQPIVGQGGIVGAEALVRWEHPERGLVPPGEFVPIAEQAGLIVPIGRWVLETACADATGWTAQAPGGKPLYVSVNVAPRQIAHSDLEQTVRDVLATTGLEPGRLGLELTESVLMDELSGPAAALRRLKRLGVRLLLDDFGTGYSSLSYLSRFPIDVLKIDRAFVEALSADTDAAIVKAVVRMAQALGVDVVAEGVETRDQLVRLQTLGCDVAQGYYFARPRPSAELPELMRQPAGALATAV